MLARTPLTSKMHVRHEEQSAGQAPPQQASIEYMRNSLGSSTIESDNGNDVARTTSVQAGVRQANGEVRGNQDEEPRLRQQQAVSSPVIGKRAVEAAQGEGAGAAKAWATPAGEQDSAVPRSVPPSLHPSENADALWKQQQERVSQCQASCAQAVKAAAQVCVCVVCVLYVLCVCGCLCV
jgi:hypothetical protein